MNRQIILASRPSGLPTNQNFDLIEVDERAPRNGEVLCKTIYLSLDPYMRGRMNEAKSYAKPVNLGDVMEGEAVSQVIKSKSDKFQVGDFVMGRTGWQDKPTAHARLFKKIDPNKAPISTSIGILGMPGVTAYTGMMNIAKPQRDETLVVAAASGAVGSTVGQIGKIFGCKVLTRPSSISGNFVILSTFFTLIPFSLILLYVFPVDTISIFFATMCFANLIISDLSDTDIKHLFIFNMSFTVFP